MSINGRISTTFGTYQADLFESGLVAQIGPNAFATWSAIKAHSDYQTGIAWPSIRRLMLLTGLASATVQKCLDTLEASHLLRSEVKNKRRYYVARERLDVAVGKRVLCTVVVDYVPATMRDTLKRVKNAIENDGDPEVFALVDIIPGDGFAWDDNAKILRASVPASEIPTPDKSEQLADVGQRIARRAQKLLKK
jgi:DNA-binding transcriptional MocR family regulator